MSQNFHNFKNTLLGQGNGLDRVVAKIALNKNFSNALQVIF